VIIQLILLTIRISIIYFICDIFLNDNLIFHYSEFLFLLVILFSTETTIFVIHPISLDTVSFWLSEGTFYLTKHKKNSQTNLEVHNIFLLEISKQYDA